MKDLLNDIGFYLKDVDYKTLLLLMMGYAFMLMGMNFGDAIKNKKLLFAIQFFPVILSFTIIVIGMIYKNHHQSFEGTLLVVLLVVSTISLFQKRKD